MQKLAALFAKASFQQATKNLGWLLVERGVRFGLGVMVGLVVARHLGPAAWGSLNYCLAVVTLFSSLAGFGLDAVVKRDLLLAPASTARLLADSTLLRVSTGALAWVGLEAYLHLAPPAGEEERRVFLALIPLLWQPALTVPDLWLQARLQARRAVLAQTVALAVCAGIRVWLVLTNASLPMFAAVYTLEVLIAAIGLHYAAWRVGLRINYWQAGTRASMLRLVRAAGPLAVAGLAVIVYMKIDEVMLRRMLGTRAVGIYSAAVRLSELGYFIPVALASSTLPALLHSRELGPASYRERLQGYFDLNAGLAYLLAMPVWIGADWIVQLAYGPAFAEAGSVLAVHIWACVFVFLGVARGQWLVNEGLTGFYLVATLSGAVANIALNLWMIPRWGPLGAAWATLISYALSAWVSSLWHSGVREVGGLQTRALLLPLFGWRYLKGS